MYERDLTVKHYNEQYFLEVNQEYERYLLKLKEKAERAEKKAKKTTECYGENFCSKNSTNLRYEYLQIGVAEYIEFACLAKMKTFCLYFGFGKYKGRVVQDILNKDEQYCEWFVHEVRGKDFTTLKVLDYLSKCLYHGTSYSCSSFVPAIHYYKYWLEEPEVVFEQVLAEIPKAVADEARKDKKEILKEFSYIEDRSYVGNSSDFDCGGMSPWEEAMSDVLDYSDLC